jgi:hypothetical protein
MDLESELQQKKSSLIRIGVIGVILVVLGAVIGRTSAPLEGVYSSKWARTIDSLKLVNETQKKLADSAKIRIDSLQTVLVKEKQLSADLYAKVTDAKNTKSIEHNKVLLLNDDDLIAKFQEEIAKTKQGH